MNDSHFYFQGEQTMTRALVLTEGTEFAEITKFFAEAGPDARVRARKNADGTVELYVRDLSMTGRLQEWWNTNSDERKNCYQLAKNGLESIIQRSERKNDHIHFRSIFESHKQDFVGGEILGLHEQLNARDEISSSLDKVFPRPLTVDGQIPERINQSRYDELVIDLREVDTDKLAKLINTLSGDKFAHDELRHNLDEFKKFAELNYSKTNSGNEPIEIDFAAAKKFLIATNEMCAKLSGIVQDLSTQEESALQDELSVLAQSTWTSLEDWGRHVAETSRHKAG